jgi:hypothetical protein
MNEQDFDEENAEITESDSYEENADVTRPDFYEEDSDTGLFQCFKKTFKIIDEYNKV